MWKGLLRTTILASPLLPLIGYFVEHGCILKGTVLLREVFRWAHVFHERFDGSTDRHPVGTTTVLLFSL